MSKSSFGRKPTVVENFTPAPKSKKLKVSKAAPERTHFDIYSKERGYLCTCLNEDDAHRALQTLFNENEQYWRNAKEGKKPRRFDCYCLARTGLKERLIELMFAPDEEDVTETYDDITQKEMA